MTQAYKPDYLRKWEKAQNYIGDDWSLYYSAGVSRHRDSGALDRSNFRCMLERLGGESNTVLVAHARHWAVGWVEWIAIHPDDVKALREADKACADLSEYPVLDEHDYDSEEQQEAAKIWSQYFSTAGRIDYIRNNSDQFDFTDFADLMGCVRGKHFNGMACELVRV